MTDRRRLRWLVLLPTVFISTVGLVAASSPATLVACALPRAVAWARAHHGELPTTLAALRQYPADYQRAIYGELSPTVRVKLWREQLAPYLATPQRFTPEQFALLRRVDAELDGLVGAASDAKSSVAPREKRTVLLEIGKLFRGSAVFKVVSAESPEAQSPGGPHLLVLEEACNCHQGEAGGDDAQCGPGVLCANPDDGCLPVPLNHCGTFLDESCDGVCR